MREAALNLHGDSIPARDNMKWGRVRDEGWIGEMEPRTKLGINSQFLWQCVDE